MDDMENTAPMVLELLQTCNGMISNEIVFHFHSLIKSDFCVVVAL